MVSASYLSFLILIDICHNKFVCYGKCKIKRSLLQLYILSTVQEMGVEIHYSFLLI